MGYIRAHKNQKYTYPNNPGKVIEVGMKKINVIFGEDYSKEGCYGQGVYH